MTTHYLVQTPKGYGVFNNPFRHTDENYVDTFDSPEAAMAWSMEKKIPLSVYGISYEAPWDTDEDCIGECRVARLDLNVDDGEEEVFVALAARRYGGAVSEQVQAILDGENLFEQNPNALDCVVELFRDRNEYRIAEALDLFLLLEDASDHVGAWKTDLRFIEQQKVTA